MDARKIVDAVLSAVRKELRASPPDDTVHATFVSEDPSDPNLSVISVNGSQISGVPKYAHVTDLTAGDLVECLHLGKRKPLTIMGVRKPSSSSVGSSYVAGSGLSETPAGTFNVDTGTASATGLEISGDTVRIATDAAGSGLSGGGGSALAVGAGTGITVNANDVALATTVAGNALTHTAGVLDVAPGAGLEISSDTIRIAAAAAGSGLTGGAGSALAVGAGTGITVNANDVALADTTAGAGLTHTAGVLAVGAGTGVTVNANDVAVDTSTIATKAYVDSKILFARKTANETVTSSTTLQNDNHLFVSVAANAVYIVELVGLLSGDDTADIKYVFTYPTGATLAGGQVNLFDTISGGASTAGDGNFRALAASASPSTALNAGTVDTNFVTCWYKGLLIMSSTAGTLQLQWAQINSVAVATGFLAGSYIKLDLVV